MCIARWLGQQSPAIGPPQSPALDIKRAVSPDLENHRGRTCVCRAVFVAFGSARSLPARSTTYSVLETAGPESACPEFGVEQTVSRSTACDREDEVFIAVRPVERFAVPSVTKSEICADDVTTHSVNPITCVNPFASFTSLMCP